MQSRWDKQFSFIHLSSSGYKRPHLKLNWKSLINVAFRMDEKDSMVFHAQSALPYLVFAFFIKKIFFLKGKYVYDIHDFHELNPKAKIFTKEYVRHIVFFALEMMVFKFNEISKITVSDGLAEIISKRYSALKPFVVKNLSLQEKDYAKFLDNRHTDSVLYFGTKERVPLDAIQKLIKNNIHIDIYGRGIDRAWLKEMIGDFEGKSIKLHGEYFPDNLDFLHLYKFTIIFAPNDVSLNFKHSLPNKLFQSLAAGLIVLVSENFTEMIDLFSDVPRAVISVNVDNIVDVIDSIKNIDGNLSLIKKIELLQAESRNIYLKVTEG